jgi:hypothetical protein
MLKKNRRSDFEFRHSRFSANLAAAPESWPALEMPAYCREFGIARVARYEYPRRRLRAILKTYEEE